MYSYMYSYVGSSILEILEMIDQCLDRYLWLTILLIRVCCTYKVYSILRIPVETTSTV